jgi:hypothetical protein
VVTGYGTTGTVAAMEKKRQHSYSSNLPQHIGGVKMEMGIFTCEVEGDRNSQCRV